MLSYYVHRPQEDEAPRAIDPDGKSGGNGKSDGLSDGNGKSDGKSDGKSGHNKTSRPNSVSKGFETAMKTG